MVDTSCPGKNFSNRIILEGSVTVENKTTRQEALETLVKEGIINSPEYWAKVADVVHNFDAFLLNVARYVNEKK